MCSRCRRIATQYSTVDQCVGEGTRLEYRPSRLKSALEHGLDPLGHQGKHTAAEQDRDSQILDWIKRNAEGGTAVTRREITDYCTGQFQVPITRGWVNSFVLRYPDKLIQAKSSPQEEQRFQGARVFLECPVQNLNRHIQGFTVGQSFNTDEVGISDWEDRKVGKVVVPATMRVVTRHQGIS
jgi:hypothetical protein